jgi:hypothetical protein
LWLRNNRISATGLAFLLDLVLSGSSRIVSLDVSGNLCGRNFSRTHHPDRGASPSETIEKELAAAVARNQVHITTAKSMVHNVMSATVLSKLHAESCLACSS